jgi:hypothetical protein
MRRMKNIQTPIIKSMGTQERITRNHESPFSGFTHILTPLLLSSAINPGSSGAKV